MTPIKIKLTYNGVDYIIEIDDFDYSVSCVYRKTNGCYTYFDDINADFEDILDTLCERLRPE